MTAVRHADNPSLIDDEIATQLPAVALDCPPLPAPGYQTGIYKPDSWTPRTRQGVLKTEHSVRYHLGIEQERKCGLGFSDPFLS